MEQLSEASAKAPRQRAGYTTCFTCSVVSKVAKLTQNYPQPLQLKSEVNQEIIMWKTKKCPLQATSRRRLLPILHFRHPPTPHLLLLKEAILINLVGHIVAFIRLICLVGQVTVFQKLYLYCLSLITWLKSGAAGALVCCLLKLT